VKGLSSLVEGQVYSLADRDRCDRISSSQACILLRSQPQGQHPNTERILEGMSEAPLCDCHFKSMDWTEPLWRLPDWGEELQYWAKCSEPNCQRHFSPKIGYFSLIAQRIDWHSIVKHWCQSPTCSDAPICMGLVESETNARNWYRFVCQTLSDFHSSR
jgi:hypothetical protein